MNEGDGSMSFVLKALNWFFWGLFMGLGWVCSNGLAALIASFFSRGAKASGLT
jgi:hypothetical protein